MGLLNNLSIIMDLFFICKKHLKLYIPAKTAKIKRLGRFFDGLL